MHIGFDRDTVRWANNRYRPIQDLPGRNEYSTFGSAHPGSFHMAFGDGSVRLIDYEIDGVIHGRQANRRDGDSVEMNETR